LSNIEGSAVREIVVPVATTGKAHTVIESLCLNIQRYALGIQAAQLLELPRAERRSKALVILPMWGWGQSLHSVGRKDRPFSQDGSEVDHDTKLLMPIRNHWDGGNLHLVSTGEIISGSLIGSGHSGVVQARIVVAATGHPAVGIVEPSELMTIVSTSVGTKVDQTLNQLVRDGQSAYWDMFRHWDNIVRRILERVSVGIIRELEEFNQESISYSPFDTACLDKIRDEILLGAKDEETRINKESRLRHYLNQAASDPELFLNVEPQRFLNKNLTRDCTSALRREMGDPHIGPKVRRFVLDNPELESLSAIIRAYNEEFPRDRLAVDRATVALEIGHDLSRMGRMVPFADHRDSARSIDSAENQAIEGWYGQ
jgi:hypothetical protein